MSSRAQQQAEAAQRRAKVLQLRLGGATFEEIGQALGVTDGRAHQLYKDALARTIQTPADEYRRLELERPDRLQAEATKVLAANHVVIQAGKAVVDEQGQPYRDHGPVLAAIQTLVRVQESRRRLLGLDPPTRHDIRAQVRTVDEIDARIAELEALLGETGTEQEAHRVKRQRADRLVAELAGEHDIDYSERVAALEHAMRFWMQWKDNSRAIHDTERFVAASLTMTVELMALPADQQQILVSRIKQFLAERKERAQ